MSILDDFSLTGCRAVVTGGGKGIGRGIALCLAEAGADVLVTARTQADVDQVAGEIGALGRTGVAHVADVTEDGALAATAERAANELGGLDIWVNNAGGLPDGVPRYLTRTARPEWQAQIDLNLTAVWEGSVAAAAQMGDGGSIINISSGAARGPSLKNGPYGASKAAVNSLTQTLSVELAPSIRVNALSPGPVPTENFVESTNYRGERKEMIDKQLRIPLGRIGTERDIGAAAVFLASPAASWITGQVLLVNGGR
ncbi:MAG: SDR family oxidoreductase [Actinomycetota bacterium]